MEELKLTPKGEERLKELQSEYDEVIGTEIFENTRLPGDGTTT